MPIQYALIIRAFKEFCKMKYPLDIDRYVHYVEQMDGRPMNEDARHIYRDLVVAMNDAYLAGKDDPQSSAESVVERIKVAAASQNVNIEGSPTDSAAAFVLAWIKVVQQAWEQGRQDAGREAAVCQAK
jgi:hypothetical protein